MASSCCFTEKCFAHHGGQANVTAILARTLTRMVTRLQEIFRLRTQSLKLVPFASATGARKGIAETRIGAPHVTYTEASWWIGFDAEV